MKGRSAVGAVVVGAALSLAACGDGDSGNEAKGTTATTADPAKTKVTASPACAASFEQGHNSERAGQPTPDAFLPSIRTCRSLEQWTAAERAFGVDLQGREAEFVDNTCNAAGPDVQSSRICREAKAAVSASARSAH